MSSVNGERSPKNPETTDRVIYRADPLAQFLVARLGMRAHTLALAGLAWGVVYLFVLPAVFGGLHSREGYLGSLQDWHTQLLLLLVFPATCAFYVWQPRGIAGVYEAMCLQGRSAEVGNAYRSRVWLWISLGAAAGIVLFDSPKMVAGYGSWWMVQNWLTILGREASLALSFYMMSMIAGRQFVATFEWRRLLAGASSPTALTAASGYQLRWAFLFALLGLRLSIEAIELPQRAGVITPDYYLKVTAYLVISVLCFYAPIWGALRKGGSTPLDQVVLWLKLAGVVALPLLGLVVLRLVLGT
jgi:hypothetical protein